MRLIPNKLWLFSLILSVFLSSCKSEDDGIQSVDETKSSIISFTLSEGTVNEDFTKITVQENAQLYWTFNFDTQVGVKYLIIEGLDTKEVYREIYYDSLTNNHAVDVLSSHKTAGDTLHLSFTAIDKLNQVHKSSAVLVVTPNYRPPKIQTAIIEFAGEINDSSRVIYSILYDTVLSSNDVVFFNAFNGVDIGFFVGTDVVIASPIDFRAMSGGALDMHDWPFKNETKMVEVNMTVNEYLALSSVEEVKSLLDKTLFIDEISTLRNVAENKIYAFKLDHYNTRPSAKSGFFRVISLETGQNSSAITLEFILDIN